MRTSVGLVGGHLAGKGSIDVHAEALGAVGLAGQRDHVPLLVAQVRARGPCIAGITQRVRDLHMEICGVRSNEVSRAACEAGGGEGGGQLAEVAPRQVTVFCS